MKYIFIILAILVVLIILAVNIIIRKNNKVKEAFSTMDVYLKKRYDLIPNLVEVTKGYADYEKNIFKEVVELRNKKYNDLSIEDKLNENISGQIKSIMALAEAYPDLKSNNNFIKLSEELVKVEDEIAFSRKYYNACIRDFNNLVETFPISIIASLFNFKSKDMFGISDDERNNTKVEM